MRFLAVFALSVEILAYIIVHPVYSVFFDFIAALFFIAVFYQFDKLTNQVLLKLGNISLEIFLLHYPVITIGGTLFKKIFPENLTVYIGEMAVLMAASIIAAILWNKHYGKMF